MASSATGSLNRPRKHQGAPPPFYITEPENTRYCRSCGRVIGAHKVRNSQAQVSEVKYCSDKCRRNRPNRSADSLDVRTENALIDLLSGNGSTVAVATEGDKALPNLRSSSRGKKGDSRVTVRMSELQAAVFGHSEESPSAYGKKKRPRRGLPDPEIWLSVDMEDANSANHPDRSEVECNDSIPTDSSADVVNITRVNHYNKSRTENESVILDEELEVEEQRKRLEGQKKADDRELVKNVARRAVVFGLCVDEASDEQNRNGEQLKKCEAVVAGKVVEPSFAKGDWQIRWRED